MDWLLEYSLRNSRKKRKSYESVEDDYELKCPCARSYKSILIKIIINTFQKIRLEMETRQNELGGAAVTSS